MESTNQPSYQKAMLASVGFNVLLSLAVFYLLATQPSPPPAAPLDMNKTTIGKPPINCIPKLSDQQEKDAEDLRRRFAQ